MKKITIIGVSGSGKSYFTKKLAEKIGLPVFHMDQLFWKANWVMENKEVFNAKVIEVTQGERWITDGNFTSHKQILHERLQRADTIFFFDFNPYVCAWRVLLRRFEHWGKRRPDMAEGCIEGFDPEFVKFLRWILNFRRHTKPKVLAAIKETGSVSKVVTFKNRGAVNRYLKSL